MSSSRGKATCGGSSRGASGGSDRVCGASRGRGRGKINEQQSPPPQSARGSRQYLLTSIDDSSLQGLNWEATTSLSSTSHASRGRGRVNEKQSPPPQSARGSRQSSFWSILSSIDEPLMQSLSLETTSDLFSSALPDKRSSSSTCGRKPVPPLTQTTSSPKKKHLAQPLKASFTTKKPAPQPQKQASRQSVLTSSKNN